MKVQDRGGQTMTVVLMVFVVVVSFLAGAFWRSKKEGAESPRPEATKAVTIANPLVEPVVVSPEATTSEIGWATAISTPSGVLIQASINIGPPGGKKGGVK
jgi:hypothetical protein